MLASMTMQQVAGKPAAWPAFCTRHCTAPAVRRQPSTACTHVGSQRTVLCSAAAIADSSAATLLLAPSYAANPLGEPKLQNRRLLVNPLQMLARTLQNVATEWHLKVAACVDRRSSTAIAAVAITTLHAATGLDLPALMARGLPWWLIAAADIDEPAVPLLLAALAALPSAAWALRCWWVANIQVMRGAAETAAQKLRARGSTVPSTLLAHAAAAARLGVLASAWRLLHNAPSAAVLQPGAAALLCLGASAAPMLLPRVRAQLAGGGTAALLLCIMGLEASWLLCAAHAPIGNAVAALGMAVCLMQIRARAVLPWLESFVARPGDEVQVHVTARLDDGTQFDSTEGSLPLRVTVGGSHACVGGAASALERTVAQASSSSGSSSRGRASSSASTSSSGAGASSDDAWQSISRWQPFMGAIGAALPAAYLCQTLAVKTLNPVDYGYWNPALCWWQPIDQVKAKFKREPLPGEVFRYPITDNDSLMARVNIVGGQFAELDANFGVAGREVVLDVRVVGLEHKADGAVMQQAAATHIGA